MARYGMERYSKDFASGVSAVKSVVGKDIWRSHGCSLIGSDEEDFVFEVAKRSLASLVL